MQLRYRFGLGLLVCAEHMCVIADELYVCDTDHHRLQVVSLAGEHRRSIMGEWKFPDHLCFANDRLYLHVDRLYQHQYRRRILVLSLQGDILQVLAHPTQPTAEFLSICCFDDKLLVSYRYDEDWESAEPNGLHSPQYAYGMLALQGV